MSSSPKSSRAYCPASPPPPLLLLERLDVQAELIFWLPGIAPGHCHSAIRKERTWWISGHKRVGDLHRQRLAQRRAHQRDRSGADAEAHPAGNLDVGVDGRAIRAQRSGGGGPA